MKNKLIYVMALATLAIAWAAQIDVLQSPPQPDCAGFPELCSDSVAK